MDEVSCWGLVVLQALAIGWLVALADAFWRLRKLLIEVHERFPPDDKVPANCGKNVSDD